ncbi:MAG: preprotein translocase subunit SecG [Firmicutes bacterium ADurb.Bin373]|mgnify:CR=1 FL=1|nr:preprotein translocase subunit SecG [Bacillota bacterium]OQA08498.1 MAG: preprotein translocase subunit SecG [Firmicutes bacterium ADurb.Bin373]
MDVLKIILTVVQVLLAIALITAVVLQSGRSAGLSGTISGGAETLFGKKKGLDELLGKVTIAVAILLGALCLILAILR